MAFGASKTSAVQTSINVAASLAAAMVSAGVFIPDQADPAGDLLSLVRSLSNPIREDLFKYVEEDRKADDNKPKYQPRVSGGSSPARPREVTGTDTLTKSGKYADKTLDWLFDNDRQYLESAAKDGGWGDKFPSLKSKAKAYLALRGGTAAPAEAEGSGEVDYLG